MRRTFIPLLLVPMLLSFSGCMSANEAVPAAESELEIIAEPITEEASAPPPEELISVEPKNKQEADAEQGGDGMNYIDVVIGEKTFSAVLYDNETASALAERFPLTLQMSELHGNEKYCYLTESLPTDASVPDSIHPGDLMLFGSDCLVLFYDSFSTSYSYTPLGYLEHPEALSETLGSGDVEITFQVRE